MEKLYKYLKNAAILVVLGITAIAIYCFWENSLSVEFKKIESYGSVYVPEKI